MVFTCFGGRTSGSASLCLLLAFLSAMSLILALLAVTFLTCKVHSLPSISPPTTATRCNSSRFATKNTPHSPPWTPGAPLLLHPDTFPARFSSGGVCSWCSWCCWVTRLYPRLANLSAPRTAPHVAPPALQRSACGLAAGTFRSHA